jgi:hypothetical protein
MFPLEQVDFAGRHRVGQLGLKQGDEQSGTRRRKASKAE